MTRHPLLLARFWSKVDVRGPDECWEWRGARDPNGYGRFHVKHGSALAHRLAFELASGDIQPEMDICHRCDNPPCCNPKHLWGGNALENVHDSLRKGRFYTGPGQKGAVNPNARLTEDQARRIRIRVELGETKTEVARDLGIGLSTVGDIMKRRTWKHI